MSTSRHITLAQIQHNNHLPSIILKQSNISSNMSSPIIEKINKLHQSNIKTIKRQHLQSLTMTQDFLLKKSTYFNTIHKHNQSVCSKVLQKIDNKKQALSKHIMMKTKRQQQNYKKAITLTQQKLIRSHNRQQSKIKEVKQRKQYLMTSRSRYMKISRQKQMKQHDNKNEQLYQMQISRSRQLEDRLDNKIEMANRRRRQILCQIIQKTKGELSQSIIYANKLIVYNNNEKENNFLNESITKYKRSEQLIYRQKDKISQKVKQSRQYTNKKLLKAQNIKRMKQNQLDNKLQKINQQINIKINSTNYKKQNMLLLFSSNQKNLRSKNIILNLNRSSIIKHNQSSKSLQLLSTRNQRWQQISKMKQLFITQRDNHLYQSQQLTLRG